MRRKYSVNRPTGDFDSPRYDSALMDVRSHPLTPRRTDGDARVLVRLPDYLGEMTMAEPAVRTLADAGLAVVAFGRPWGSELLAGVGVQVRTAGAGPETIAAYRREHAAWGVALRGSFSTAWRMRMAGLRVIGRRGNLRSFLLHRALPRRRPGHRIDEYLEVSHAALAAIGAACQAASPSDGGATPLLRATADQVAEARGRLEAAGVGKRFVVCCPTAGHTRRISFKLWPAFPEMIVELLAGGSEVVICPGRGETSWYEGIPPGVRVIEGVGVGCLLGIVSLATGVISNDTGTAHLAGAAGTPTLVVFGDTSPERYAARGTCVRHVGALGRWPSQTEASQAWRELVVGARMSQVSAEPRRPPG
jgi:heptosyltransferase II